MRKPALRPAIEEHAQARQRGRGVRTAGVTVDRATDPAQAQRDGRRGLELGSLRVLREGIEVRMAEGIFGTGPGGRSDWDNRWDFGISARWNLMEHFTRCDRERIIQAKAEQAHLAYQDLRAKLTAGVHEARAAILSGREQIQVTQRQINEAQRAHRLSDDRLKNNIAGSSASEVLLSLQQFSLARASYVNVVRAYDKAQLRLLILLGTPGDRFATDGNCPIPSGRGQ